MDTYHSASCKSDSRETADESAGEQSPPSIPSCPNKPVARETNQAAISSNPKPFGAAEPLGDPDSTRVILHFDIDAFYAQVEEMRDPSLREKPLGITQKFLVVSTPLSGSGGLPSSVAFHLLSVVIVFRTSPQFCALIRRSAWSLYLQGRIYFFFGGNLKLILSVNMMCLHTAQCGLSIIPAL